MLNVLWATQEFIIGQVASLCPSCFTLYLPRLFLSQIVLEHLSYPYSPSLAALPGPKLCEVRGGEDEGNNAALLADVSLNVSDSSQSTVAD